MHSSAHFTSRWTRRADQSDRTRIHVMRMIDKMTQFILMMSITLHRPSLAVEVPVIVAINRSVHRDTTQEEHDRDALRSAPENKPAIRLMNHLRE